jgi:hypothetical protein
MLNLGVNQLFYKRFKMKMCLELCGICPPSQVPLNSFRLGDVIVMKPNVTMLPSSVLSSTSRQLLTGNTCSSLSKGI